MKKKIIFGIIAILLIATSVYAGEYKTRYNTFTGKQDWVRGDDPTFTGDLSANGSMTASAFFSAVGDRQVVHSDNGELVGDSGFVYTSGGNVGIGTSSPLMQLDIGNDNYANLLLKNTGTANPDLAATIDLIETGGDWDGTTMFGELQTYGFRIKLDGNDNLFNIQSGSEETVNTRLSIKRDSGNVGIGTTSPSRKLNVISTVDSDGIQIRRNSDATNSYGNLGFRISTYESSSSQVELRAIRTDTPISGDAGLAFAVQGNSTVTERMRISSLGNVGIGTATPTAKLHVSGDAIVSNNLTIGDGNCALAEDANVLKFTTDSGVNWVVVGSGSAGGVETDTLATVTGRGATTATQVTMSNGLNVSGGNVGIGTTSPALALDLSSSGVVRGTLNVGSVGSSGGVCGVLAFGGVSGVTDGFTIRNDEGGNYITVKSNTSGNQAVMQAGGNVGIGTTSPSAKLNIVTGGSDGLFLTAPYTNLLRFTNTSYTGNRRNWQFVTESVGEGALTLQMSSTDGGTPDTTILHCANTGNVGIGGTTTTATLYVNGSLAKTSGSFDIAYPDPVKADDGWRLRHCFVESNTRGDNLYRYTAYVTDEATIDLPTYFDDLNENAQVFVSASDHLGYGYGTIDINTLTVYVNSAGTYNVLVIGTRKDQYAKDWYDGLGDMYQVEDNTDSIVAYSKVNAKDTESQIADKIRPYITVGDKAKKIKDKYKDKEILNVSEPTPSN